MAAESEPPFLIVGLGNPGSRYAAHRHNVGFMALDRFVAGLGLTSYRSKFKSETLAGELHRQRFVALKPQTYMNCSGQAVQAAAAFYSTPPERIVVAHDEIDFPLGRIAIKVGGGHGGHNGLRDIIAQMGSPAFLRIRLGVGRPEIGDVADWVLSGFAPHERDDANALVTAGAEAISAILDEGASLAMNRINRGAAKG